MLNHIPTPLEPTLYYATFVNFDIVFGFIDSIFVKVKKEQEQLEKESKSDYSDSEEAIKSFIKV